MGEFVKVASANEIAPGQARLINIKGEEIALFNIEGVFFAVQNACTHEEGPLVERDIEGHEVTCPWHGARFDVRTGEVLCPPAYEDVHRYNVRLIGTDIELEI
jgi:nitrite reductase/ring-hydroxylating ferredoxin subunit